MDTSLFGLTLCKFRGLILTMSVCFVFLGREGRRSSEDVRRLPLLPLSKHHHRPPGGSNGGIHPASADRTPTSPMSVSMATSPTSNPGASPIYIANGQPNGSIVGRVEHLLNQTEHILSRTESLDSTNTQSAGLQRLLSHKEQLEHVERLLAQAEYAIWLEKRSCAQQVSQLGPNDSSSMYGYSSGSITNGNGPASFLLSANSNGVDPNASSGSTPGSKVVTNHCGNANSSSSSNNNHSSSGSIISTHNNSTNHHHHHSNSTSSNKGSANNSSNGSLSNSNCAPYAKKLSKNLEEESVV